MHRLLSRISDNMPCGNALHLKGQDNGVSVFSVFGRSQALTNTQTTSVAASLEFLVAKSIQSNLRKRSTPISHKLLFIAGQAFAAKGGSLVQILFGLDAVLESAELQITTITILGSSPHG